MFKDIHTFLGLYYRDALHITVYFVYLESLFQNSDEWTNFISQKFVVKKAENQHV